ncbi:hypothetical protein HDU96_003855, partial [Phlyctochytrium bullatum]
MSSSSTQDDCAALEDAFPALVPSGSGDCCATSIPGGFNLSTERNSGITCRQGRIVAIDLSTRTLRIDTLPTLAPSLATLDQLEMLRIYQSNLTGTIPAYLGSFSNLRFLDLTSGTLSGPIPRELGNLQRLESLDLSNNNLSSTLPSELTNLQALRNLFLRGNSLYGSIPSSLGQLPLLNNLDIRSNYFNGAVPTSLSRLRRKKIEGNCFSSVENATAFD